MYGPAIPSNLSSRSKTESKKIWTKTENTDEEFEEYKPKKKHKKKKKHHKKVRFASIQIKTIDLVLFFFCCRVKNIIMNMINLICYLCFVNISNKIHLTVERENLIKLKRAPCQFKHVGKYRFR